MFETFSGTNPKNKTKAKLVSTPSQFRTTRRRREDSRPLCTCCCQNRVGCGGTRGTRASVPAIVCLPHAQHARTTLGSNFPHDACHALPAVPFCVHQEFVRYASHVPYASANPGESVQTAGAQQTFSTWAMQPAAMPMPASLQNDKCLTVPKCIPGGAFHRPCHVNIIAHPLERQLWAMTRTELRKENTQKMLANYTASHSANRELKIHWSVCACGR